MTASRTPATEQTNLDPAFPYRGDRYGVPCAQSECSLASDPRVKLLRRAKAGLFFGVEFVHARVAEPPGAFSGVKPTHSLLDGEDAVVQV